MIHCHQITCQQCLITLPLGIKSKYKCVSRLMTGETRVRDSEGRILTPYQLQGTRDAGGREKERGDDDRRGD